MKSKKYTLTELIANLNSRIGQADGYAEKGAYWIAFDQRIAQRGGGKYPLRSIQSLQIRHYRSGEVESIIEFLEFHEDSDRESRTCLSLDLSGATSVEEVIVGLLSFPSTQERFPLRPVVDEEFEKSLIKALQKLGLALAPAASPDETDSGISAVGETMAQPHQASLAPTLVS
jgi:hypothetical protein